MPDLLTDLTIELRRFAEERDWEQFHSPKNLAMAMIVEAAELVEHFQWQSQEESFRPDERQHQAIADEVADVLIYLTRLADRLDIDMHQAVRRKMKLNAQKYPAKHVGGD